MKVLPFLTLLLICTSTFAQEKIDSLVAKTACECMTKTNASSDEIFEDCIIDAFQKHQEDITRYAIQKFGEATEETGFKAGRELGERIAITLIFTCDKYYRILDSMRNASLLDIDKDSVKSVIAEKNKNKPAQPDSDYFEEMGILYFYLSDFDKAITNFNSAGAKSLSAMFFKAWALELKRNFDESLALYTRIALLTGKNEYHVFSALVKRKMSEL